MIPIRIWKRATASTACAGRPERRSVAGQLPAVEKPVEEKPLTAARGAAKGHARKSRGARHHPAQPAPMKRRGNRRSAKRAGSKRTAAEEQPKAKPVASAARNQPRRERGERNERVKVANVVWRGEQQRQRSPRTRRETGTGRIAAKSGEPRQPRPPRPPGSASAATRRKPILKSGGPLPQNKWKAGTRKRSPPRSTWRPTQYANARGCRTGRHCLAPAKLHNPKADRTGRNCTGKTEAFRVRRLSRRLDAAGNAERIHRHAHHRNAASGSSRK